MSSSSKMIVLESADGELFNVEERVALQSEKIKHMIEEGCANTIIPVNLTSKTLSSVIDYCNKHVEAPNSEVDREYLKAFDADFVKVDHDTLFNIVLAAYDLKIRSLLDLTCQAVADMIRGKTPEQIRKIFNIRVTTPPTEEEEDAVRVKMPWAFE